MLSVKLPDPLAKQLREAAQRRSRTVSELVRELLESYLAERDDAPPESFHALAQDLIVDDPASPGDLSCGRRHLDGFGA